MRPSGRRIHSIDFQQHDGSTDGHNQPTYTSADNWTTEVSGLWCEVLTISSRESPLGRQTTTETTHVAFSEYYGAQAITSDMRAVWEGSIYAVVGVTDPNNDNREMRIELKRET